METINKTLWLLATTLILINSIYFSLVLKFPQLKLINVFKSLKKGQKKEIITPLDTLIMTLSSKIGVGSLAGVALCICYGGLGTIMWIWISTLFLSIITYIENNLAIIYKEKDKDINKSGPAYYIKKGLNKNKLSLIYAILIIITYSFLFPSIQNNTIITLTNEVYEIDIILTSLLITILSSVIIFKGIKQVSKICNKIFPFMMILFLITGILIMIININELPGLLKTIIREGISYKSINGGIIYTIITALQRTIFANESGVGTSSMISGLTDNNDYKLQGNIGIVQTYFINMIVLTTTAIIIGLSNYQDINIINGIELTKYAYSYHLGHFGEIILLIILFLFSFSSIITIYYFGENSLKSITTNKKIINLLKIATILSIFIGGIIKAKIIWNLIDIFLALLTIINMYAIYKLKDKIIKKML